MKLEFTTDLKCGGCLAKVEPLLEKEESVSSWKVDLESEEKLLSVEGESLSAERIQELFREAGFEAKEKQTFFNNLFG